MEVTYLRTCNSMLNLSNVHLKDGVLLILSKKCSFSLKYWILIVIFLQKIAVKVPVCVF